MTVYCQGCNRPIDECQVRSVQCDKSQGKRDCYCNAVLPPNPKQIFGDKKPSLHLVPPAASLYMALAMRNGAEKYGPFNWRDKAVEVMTYIGAAERHMKAWVDGEELADDSGIPHLAHALASLAILVDALEVGNAIDNRPPPGSFARLVEKWSKRDVLKPAVEDVANRAPPACPDTDDLWCNPVDAAEFEAAHRDPVVKHAQSYVGPMIDRMLSEKGR